MKVHDDTLIILTEAEKKQRVDVINNILSNLLCLRDTIKNDHLVQGSIETHVGLNEAYHTDLAKVFNFESVLAEERKERFREIREKNIEIQELLAQRGKEVTSEAVTGALKRFNEIFRAWYENEGFHYASIISQTAYGISAKMTCDMNNSYDKDTKSEVESVIWSDECGTESKIALGWDILKCQYDNQLLDTDNNRSKITELLTSAFPKSKIHSFVSRRNDYGSFSLNFEMFVPYKDIELYYLNLMGKGDDISKD